LFRSAQLMSIPPTLHLRSQEALATAGIKAGGSIVHFAHGGHVGKSYRKSSKKMAAREGSEGGFFKNMASKVICSGSKMLLTSLLPVPFDVADIRTKFGSLFSKKGKDASSPALSPSGSDSDLDDAAVAFGELGRDSLFEECAGAESLGDDRSDEGFGATLAPPSSSSSPSSVVAPSAAPRSSSFGSGAATTQISAMTCVWGL
jgi:hypothetical protein